MTDFSYVVYSPSKIIPRQTLLPLHKNACGNRLNLIRTQRNLSLTEVVQVLRQKYKLNLSVSDLDAIEHQNREISDLELLALSQVLRVHVTWLLYGGTTQAIRVLLFDKDSFRSDTIQSILEMDHLLNLVGSYSDFQKIFEIVQNLKPDIILLDLDLGLDIIPPLLQYFGPTFKFIILSKEPHLKYILDATTLGIHGFLGKSIGLLELPARIKMIDRGDFQFDPYSTRLFVNYMSYKQLLTSTQMLVLSGILQRKNRLTLQKELTMSKEALRQHIYRIADALELKKFRGEGAIRRHFENGSLAPLNTFS